ncbi:MAG: EamA family transporter, partial [Oscillospiraceae bacterium]|nr:EamA family transporter [Oscillospiraceae bacterium]
AAVGFTAVVAVRSPEKLRIRLRDIWMFVGTGIVSVVLFNVFYFSTIVNSQASVAVVLLYTSPIFVMLLSAVIFREKITRRKLIALAMTFLGCVLVAGLVGGGYSIPPLVLLTGLGSGLFYALYTIFGRFALEKYDTMTVTAYTFLFGLLGSLPMGHPGRVLSIVSAQPSLIFWCLGVGVICAVLPYFFYTWGLQRMESGRVAILVAVEPLVGAVIGMTVFHESHDPLKLIGIALILGAIVLLNRGDQSPSA